MFRSFGRWIQAFLVYMQSIDYFPLDLKDTPITPTPNKRQKFAHFIPRPPFPTPSSSDVKMKIVGQKSTNIFISCNILTPLSALKVPSTPLVTETCNLYLKFNSKVIFAIMITNSYILSFGGYTCATRRSWKTPNSSNSRLRSSPASFERWNPAKKSLWKICWTQKTIRWEPLESIDQYHAEASYIGRWMQACSYILNQLTLLCRTAIR